MTLFYDGRMCMLVQPYQGTYKNSTFTYIIQDQDKSKALNSESYCTARKVVGSIPCLFCNEN